MRILLIILLFTGSLQAQNTIITEAQNKMGTRIGTGNCRHFVNKILKNTGNTIGPGDTIPHSEVSSGDIFLTAGFYQLTIGYIYDELIGIGPHVAIVLEVLDNNRYEIIEQNADSKKVSIRIIDLSPHGDTRDYGTYFLRPVPGKHGKANRKFIKWQY